MKFTRSTAVAAAALLLLAGLLTGTTTGCARKKLTGTPDGFVDKAGTTYQAAPACYTPAALGKKCGTLNGSEAFGIDLYVVEGMDSDVWLAGEEGQIFYADSETLPTLTDMAPKAVYVCTKDKDTKKAEITDAAIIAGLVDACRAENADTFAPGAVISSDYVLHFTSETYPGLYYTLRYVEYQGNYYLYDWETKARYAIGSEIYDALYGSPEGDTPIDGEIAE